jgi:type III secretion protein R
MGSSSKHNRSRAPSPTFCGKSGCVRPGARSRAPSGSWASGALCLAFVTSLAESAHAAPAQAAETQELLARPIALVLLLALVALLPLAFMTLTAFVKISTVLQIVRGAIGAQNVPSNIVVMALAAVLTLLAMAPVGSRIAERAKPVLEATKDTMALATGIFQASREPLRAFLKANSSEEEQARFFDVARRARPEAERADIGRDDLLVVIPAFIVTELIEAFALGFAIYLPFLVIDLVVANVLLALGMQMMSPTQVSLPFKLLLFVAVDGWGLLAQALVSAYRSG